MNWRVVRNVQGFFFALLNTVDKLGSAIAVGIIFFILEQVVGFQAGGENSAEVIHGVLIVYCLAPIIAYLLTFIPLIRYPLHKQAHEEVRQELEARATT